LLVVLVGCTAWAIHEADGAAQRGAFRNNPPPVQQRFPRPNDAEKDGRGFMDRAIDDLRFGDDNARQAAAARLAAGPNDARQRADFQAAQADPDRRREVAVLLADLLKRDAFARDDAAEALKRFVVPDRVPDLDSQT